MKISICLPVIGREKMLFQALCSILYQDHDDWEILLRDGDPLNHVSRDQEIQKLFSVIGDRLRYFVQPKEGIFHAFNDCLRISNGDVLYCMGSDDFLCPGALSAVRRTFEAERFGGPCWAYGQTISIDSTGRITGFDGEPSKYEKIVQKNCVGLPSVFWNRQMMELAGKFDTRYLYATDYDLWLRFWKFRDPIFINRELGMYRHHDKQASVLYSEALEREARKVSERHFYFGDITQKARCRLVEKNTPSLPAHE